MKIRFLKSNETFDKNNIDSVSLHHKSGETFSNVRCLVDNDSTIVIIHETIIDMLNHLIDDETKTFDDPKRSPYYEIYKGIVADLIAKSELVHR